MTFLLQVMPAWLLCLLIVGVCIILSWLSIRVTHKVMKQAMLEKYKDVIGAFVTIASLLYGILLAFVVIAVWESYENSENNTVSEANALGKIYRDANAFDSGDAAFIKGSLKNYTLKVMNDEWVLHEKGLECEDCVTLLASIYKHILEMKVNDGKQSIIYKSLIDECNSAYVYRRIRMGTSTAMLPGFLWVALLLGEVTMIVFMSFFYIEDRRLSFTLNASVAAFTGILLTLTLALNHPFVGSVGIKPEAYQQLIDHTFKHIDEVMK